MADARVLGGNDLRVAGEPSVGGRYDCPIGGGETTDRTITRVRRRAGIAGVPFDMALARGSGPRLVHDGHDRHCKLQQSGEQTDGPAESW